TPTIAPPAPAAATPSANARAATEGTRTPTSSAPLGLTAAARIARPSQVLASSRTSVISTTTASTPPYTWALGRNSPANRNDSSTYAGRIAVEVFPQTVPIAASITSARPKVSRTVEAIGAVRMGATTSL